jgi:phosphoglucosamine mutase
MINVRLPEGSDWTRNSHLAGEIEAVRAELGRQGRLLIRPSGTEPVLRVMVEAQDAATASRQARRLADAAQVR